MVYSSHTRGAPSPRCRGRSFPTLTRVRGGAGTKARHGHPYRHRHSAWRCDECHPREDASPPGREHPPSADQAAHERGVEEVSAPTMPSLGDGVCRHAAMAGRILPFLPCCSNVGRTRVWLRSRRKAAKCGRSSGSSTGALVVAVLPDSRADTAWRRLRNLMARIRRRGWPTTRRRCGAAASPRCSSACPAPPAPGAAS
jgi:hypothetical protein